jgi:hypothetical protein
MFKNDAVGMKMRECFPRLAQWGDSGPENLCSRRCRHHVPPKHRQHQTYPDSVTSQEKK